MADETTPTTPAETQEAQESEELDAAEELEQDIPPSPEPSHGVAPWRTALPVTKTVPVEGSEGKPEGSEE